MSKLENFFENNYVDIDYTNTKEETLFCDFPGYPDDSYLLVGIDYDFNNKAFIGYFEDEDGNDSEHEITLNKKQMKFVNKYINENYHVNNYK